MILRKARNNPVKRTNATEKDIEPTTDGLKRTYRTFIYINDLPPRPITGKDGKSKKNTPADGLISRRTQTRL